jgi:uncharacterized protein (TIGR03066 family)
MRAILGCALAVALVANAGFAEEKKVEIDAKKLIGKWEPKEKEGKAFVVEFQKDGKLTFTAGGKDKELKADGTYKVDGNKLVLTIKFGEKEEKMTRTVSKLTDTELTSSDDKGKEDTLVKIKEK